MEGGGSMSDEQMELRLLVKEWSGLSSLDSIDKVRACMKWSRKVEYCRARYSK